MSGQVEVDVVTLASEFPNDNSALHRGAIWVCLDPTALPTPERAAVEAEPQVLVEAMAIVVEEIEAREEAIAARVEADADAEADAAADPAALAADLDSLLDDAPVLVAPPRPSGIIAIPARDAIPESFEIEALDADEEVIVCELEPVTEAVLEGSTPPPPMHDVGLVSLEGGALDAAPAAPEPLESAVVLAAAANDVAGPTTTELPPASDDPFTVLVGTLVDVAIGAGSPHVAAVLPGLLGHGRLDHPLSEDARQALVEASILDGDGATEAFTRTARAWRAILDGTSDDFDATGGAMLDEWAADLLARLLGAPTRAQSLRRELRAKGVAAFGLAA